MAHDVFLSYSSQDKAAADAACNVLERKGVRVWMAPRDILPGVGWAQSIIGAINNARIMVLVYSSSANASHQIEREVERAINKGIPVMPFRVEDVQPNATLEYFISETHWLDAFTPPLEKHLERLADAVKRLLASQFVQPGGAPAGAGEARKAETSETSETTEAAPADAAEAPPPVARLTAPEGEAKPAKPEAPPADKAAEASETPPPRKEDLRPRKEEEKDDSRKKERKLEPINRRLVLILAGGAALVAVAGVGYAFKDTLFPPASVVAAQEEQKGDAYRLGRGVAKDYAQAASWYQKAADLGDAGAQTNLGDLYREGQGVAQEYAQALTW